MPSAIPTKIWRLLPLRIEKVNLYANMEFQKPSPTCQKKSKKKKKNKKQSNSINALLFQKCHMHTVIKTVWQYYKVIHYSGRIELRVKK